MYSIALRYTLGLSRNTSDVFPIYRLAFEIICGIDEEYKDDGKRDDSKGNGCRPITPEDKSNSVHKRK